MIHRPSKHFTKSLFFYFLFAAVFTAGFFLGVLQSAGWCTERYDVSGNSALQQATLQNVRDLAHPKYRTFLVIVVFSSPANHLTRRAARETWLSLKGSREILHFFAVGSKALTAAEVEKLRSENRTHGDLMMLDDVRDSFATLSEKLRAVIRWVDLHVNYTFLLKVDDDSFVRLNAMHDAANKVHPHKVYWGFFDGQAGVKRRGKWAELSWFLCDRYLPYAKGGGYLLSADVVRLLSSLSEHASLYQNEDVTLGVWTAPLDLNRIHDPRFDTEFVTRGCSNLYLVTHKQTPAMMAEKYRNLLQSGKLCAGNEVKNRYSYVYNWDVLPSKCCVRNDSKVP